MEVEERDQDAEQVHALSAGVADSDVHKASL